MKVITIAVEARILNEINFSLRMRYPDAEVKSIDKTHNITQVIEDEAADVVMIDSSCPGINTLDLIRDIRKVSDTLLIVITESESTIDKAQFLDTGADEYVSRPVSPVELLSKLRALLRRAQKLGFQEERTISTGNGLTVNLSRREVLLSGKQIYLTPHEYDLLVKLVRNLGRVVSHRVLLDRVWGSEYADDSDFLKKYIYRLRCKLEANPKKPKMLLNERGIGYKLMPAFTFLLCSAVNSLLTSTVTPTIFTAVKLSLLA